MRKLVLLFFIGILLVTGCNKADLVKKTSFRMVNNWEQEQVKALEDFLDYYYIAGDKVSLYDSEGNRIRYLFQNERIGVIELNGENTLVETRARERGYVSQGSLTKTVSMEIPDPMKGVSYDIFPSKDDPLTNYKKVRGVYLAPDRIYDVDNFLKDLKGSEINAIVLDYKSDYGGILFPSEVAKKYNVNADILVPQDPKGYIKKLKDQGYYLIARIVVFKSSNYALANKEHAIVGGDGEPLSIDGGYWGSPYDRAMWKYIIELSHEAYAYGFDEIQYDYVRFPVVTDDHADLRNKNNEDKTETIQKFLMEAKESFAGMPMIISADVFGWATTALDDVGIGQQWEAISNVVDVICPMIYPSHYNSGVYGIENPNEDPYHLVKYGTLKGVERNRNIPTPAIIRPWIQAFSMGGVTYGAKEIADQVRALKELNIDEYLLWNSSGVYNLEELKAKP